MKKILVVFGTRPEAIKMAPLVKEFLKFSDQFDLKVCVTGQHREMLDQVLQLFDIIPDHDLNIMKQGQDLTDITIRILEGLKQYMALNKPDIVLVHGDTTTSMAAAMASFYQQVPVGHIEAGLRTFNKYSPWPEEMNRSITGRISEYHFCPTLKAKENLLKEGIDDVNIFVTGNTVIDALLHVSSKIQNESELTASIIQQLERYGLSLDLQEKWKTKSRKLVLITGHRRENFGGGFERICNAIVKLAGDHQDVDFVYPVHLNPNVRKPVEEIIRARKQSNVHIIEPLDYLPFVYLLENSYLILTDSGGIQEEAPSFGKPVLVMRETTERPEAIDAGTVKLVGTNISKIYDEVNKLLVNHNEYLSISRIDNPYGDGMASQRIVKFFMDINEH